MSRLIVLCFVILAIPLLAWAQCTNCPGSDKGAARCACNEFHRYHGSAELTSLHVMIKAESDCVKGFALAMRNDRGRMVCEIPLTGPHSGDQAFDLQLKAPCSAETIRQAVLINNTSNSVKITYMKITGQLTDGEFVFFEKECPGVVIGAKGCARMVLFEGEK